MQPSLSSYQPMEAATGVQSRRDSLLETELVFSVSDGMDIVTTVATTEHLAH